MDSSSSGSTSTIRDDTPIPAERAHLIAVASSQQGSCTLERLADRLGAGVRVPVRVAADPGAEAKRRPGRRNLYAVFGKQALGRVEQALLEEPEPVPDLVDDARPLRPHLVRLPQLRDLGRQLGLDLVPPDLREQ